MNLKEFLKTPKMLNYQEYLKQMKQIIEDYADLEIAHKLADDLIIKFLKEFSFTDLATLYEQVEIPCP